MVTHLGAGLSQAFQRSCIRCPAPGHKEWGQRSRKPYYTCCEPQGSVCFGAELASLAALLAPPWQHCRRLLSSSDQPRPPWEDGAVQSPGLGGHQLCPRRSFLTSGGCSAFRDVTFWDLGTQPTLPLSPPALSVRPAGISAETKCYLSPSFRLSPSWLQMYPDSSARHHQIFIPSSAGWPDRAAGGSLSCQTIKATLGQCLS